MKKMTLIIILITLIMLNNTCERKNCHKRIKIHNKSSKGIYAKDCFSAPNDTICFKIDPSPALAPDFHKIEPGATNTGVLHSRDCWEYHFEYFPSKILMVFIFDAEVLESTPWDTVCANYMVLKRYDLTLNDLKNMNWEITYP